MKKKNEIVLFETSDKEVSLQVQMQDETVWLTQNQMIELFGRDQSVISRHINNVFKEGEVDKESNMHFLHITMFLYFLDKNRALFIDGGKRIADYTLAALTIMIAESRPEEKEPMVNVIMNCLV